MKIYNRYFLLIFSIFLIIPTYADVIIAQTFDHQFRESATWRLSREKYEALEELDWEKNPKLDILEAVKKAIRLTSDKYPDHEITVARVSIVQPIRVEDRRNIYFYEISIDVNKKGRNLALSRTNQVVMFLNGDVVAPVITKN